MLCSLLMVLVHEGCGSGYSGWIRILVRIRRASTRIRNSGENRASFFSFCVIIPVVVNST